MKRIFVLVLTCGLALNCGMATAVTVNADPTAPWHSERQLSDKPLPKQTPKLALPQLQSVMCQANRCKGVVNNQIVLKGDVVSGFRVVGIYPSHLVIAKGRQQWQLRVRKPTDRIKIG